MLVMKARPVFDAVSLKELSGRTNGTLSKWTVTVALNEAKVPL